ncbi:GDSL-type esterase/lipase family protein [Streptomyces sp. NPDC048566]|uniref:GDSL-type esterase/lipase family protein n=1 Tax=Streptomyces sp. NPDC048566 TaxID=3365569 RepID=UPI00371C76EA
MTGSGERQGPAQDRFHGQKPNRGLVGRRDGGERTGRARSAGGSGPASESGGHTGRRAAGDPADPCPPGEQAAGRAPRGPLGAEAPGEHADRWCLSPGEGAELFADAEWRRAVVLGDSIADSVGMTVVPGWARAPWTDRVAAALREARPGFACLHPRGRRDLPLSHVRSTQLADALGFGADLALLSCGAAELRAASFEPDVIEMELGRILAALRSAACRTVLVVTPFDLASAGSPPAARRSAVRARQRLLVERVESVALRHGCVAVDLAAYGGAAASGLWGTRPGRLSSRGHALAAAAVVRTLGGLPRT